ncbi:Rrf2 family transcriptional regulator [Marinitoga sp. 1135]|uniref:Rrf2 family protein, putative transcriptional regulator n=1 Tax=Marinitoga piezophila (strain DSM 14283 / JCM 11233 / KA3) TaxID=443254 RepID=H2J678_MARPK|nr:MULTISPECIES: Rrf2 family transcriptional regulator [Marinitoga]AEX86226.1 rrf2 family protein, putative transcriptional regulator [Marinitoga piezophila KA3]APT76637.1 Rrf2 family transcriptional regulator [Marinitoga sp. 1137]NUU96412.1 Rrf2 family transcriptional regulator [Marinitoga sp. 1135]NUU98333.1 Rrf2 family transcriptional regulator [Marinitoga sp. 1138]
MGLTVKSSYALRALYELALFHKNGVKRVSINELSAKQKIPKDFLEKIFSELREYKIVDSVRGRYGGYALSRKPEDLKLSEVIYILDRPFQSYECVVTGKCETLGSECAVGYVWKKINTILMSELSKITLADLLKIGEKLELMGGNTVEEKINNADERRG